MPVGFLSFATVFFTASPGSRYPATQGGHIFSPLPFSVQKSQTREADWPSLGKVPAVVQSVSPLVQSVVDNEACDTLQDGFQDLPLEVEHKGSQGRS